MKKTILTIITLSLGIIGSSHAQEIEITNKYQLVESFERTLNLDLSELKKEPIQKRINIEDTASFKKILNIEINQEEK